MKKRKIIPISLLLILFTCLGFLIKVYINNIDKNTIVQIKDLCITHDDKFGGVFADISIDEFNKLGFNYGDSIDVLFSTGYKIEDLPYYNGYYVDMGEALVLGYHNHDQIKIGINYGDDLWKLANLNDKNTVTFTLNEKKKYLNIQESSDIHYTDIQGDIPDIVFGNFRNVNVGKLKENILYRSASPIDNSHNRAPIVDKLIKENNIKYIIDLSDDEENIKEHIEKNDFNSPYFKSLYDNNKVITLSMNMNFKDQDFSNKIKKIIEAIANNEGPYLVHCVEGKDRTGFVSMVLEALAGASYDEILNDYMLTYKNYYNITQETEPTKYNTIKEKNIDLMLKYITNSNDLKNINYGQIITTYLKSIGLTDDIINKAKNNIIK